MSLINCKAELSLTWGEKDISYAGNAATFKITEPELYVSVFIGRK